MGPPPGVVGKITFDASSLRPSRFLRLARPHVLLSLSFQGIFSEADMLLARSQGIREKVLGSEHPDFGATLHERARVWTSQVHPVRMCQDTLSPCRASGAVLVIIISQKGSVCYTEQEKRYLITASTNPLPSMTRPRLRSLELLPCG